jgi:hypothetical protein
MYSNTIDGVLVVWLLLVVEKRAAKVASLALGACCLQATSNGLARHLQ